MFRLKKLMLSSFVLFTLVLLPGTAYSYSIVDYTGYLNAGQSAGTSAKIMDKLYTQTQTSILQDTNDLYKNNNNSIIGRVYGAYASMETPAPRALPGVSDRGNFDKALKIAEYAHKFMGVRYVYGGTSPKGFDCSGLTYYVFRQFGISLERRASYQARQGIAVKKSDLQVGDLVFFDTDGGHNNITHVGIYIGNDKFIHAESGSVARVSVSSLSENYYARNYMTARRVIN